MTQASSRSGMTLPETLIIVLILSILFLLTAPQFHKLQNRWLISNTVESMRSTLLYARSQAIQQRGNIVIQKYANSKNCNAATNNNEWSCGWFVFNDLNRDGNWSKSEPKLQDIHLDGKIQITNSLKRASVRMNRFGMLGSLGANSFVFFIKEGEDKSSYAKTLCISSGGRIRITDGTYCKRKS